MKEYSRVLYDKIALPSMVFCANFGIRPNHITMFNHLITLTLGCYFFSRGEYIFGLLGLLVMFINGFLDYLDGDMAKATNTQGKLGEWLDSGFDIVIQNAVMGAIGVGCMKLGMPYIILVLFFIGNSASNFVSFHYNQRFGFNSDKGNEFFRGLFKRDCHPINKFLRNIIDPTGDLESLAFYTYRYWVLFGCIFNVMPSLFMCLTIVCNFRWFVMFVVYAVYLAGEDRLFILKALSAMDEEKEDYYALRSGQEI